MASPSPRRKDALAVHSLQRFVFSVPDLADAGKFYRAFGLDVREVDGRLDLYAFGHPHRWASIYQRAGGKRLEYIALGAYAEDYDALVKRLGSLRVPSTAPHRLADDEVLEIMTPLHFTRCIVGEQPTIAFRGQRMRWRAIDEI